MSYDDRMHRTLWTLILALLLQLLAGNSWAAFDSRPSAEHHANPALHCHEPVTHDDAAGQTGSVQVGTHHCCAVGVGVAVQVQLPALPQAQPISPLVSWSSWRMRPDLPPPI
jgi:hypothetical protein